jgi:hypothetical protein
VYVISLKPGAHTAESVDGVSVIVYSDAPYESIGYAGAIGVSTINSMDTIPPIIKSSAVNATTIRVRTADSDHDKSGLSHFEIRKLTNMKLVQPKDFVEGNGMDSSYFDLAVTDASKAASATVEVYDMAGNHTTVTSSYPGAGGQQNPLHTEAVDFGSLTLGNTLQHSMVLQNTSASAVTVTAITSDNTDYHVTEQLPFTIPANGSMNVSLLFTPTSSGPSSTILHFTTSDAGTLDVAANATVFPAADVPAENAQSELAQWVNGGQGEVRALSPSPNPVHGIATLAYATRHSGMVSIALFDLLGNQVLTVEHGNLPSGVHQANIDARLLPAGSYFYRIESNGEVVSGKLIVGN